MIEILSQLSVSFCLVDRSTRYLNIVQAYSLTVCFCFLSCHLHAVSMNADNKWCRTI